MHVKKLFIVLFSMLFLIFINIENTYAHPREHEEFYEKFKEQYQKLSSNEKQEVNQIISTLHDNLHKLGVHVPPMHFIKMEQKKECIKKLIRDVGSEKLTVEEAEKQLNSSCFYKEKKHGNDKMLEKLDEKSKKEALIIFDLMKRGEISKEDGKSQLKELGVELPEKKDLDSKTIEKAHSYITETKKKLKKFNLDLPEEMYKRAINRN